MVKEPLVKGSDPFSGLWDLNPLTKRTGPFSKKYGDPEKNVNFCSVLIYYGVRNSLVFESKKTIILALIKAHNISFMK